MGDTLRQVAKQLRKNQERTNYNLSRYARNFPLVERARDSFTSSLSFNMEIQAVPNQKTRITFNFFEPFTTGGTFYRYEADIPSTIGGPISSVAPDSTNNLNLPSDLPPVWYAIITGGAVYQNAITPVDGTSHFQIALYSGATQIAVNDGTVADEGTASWGNHWDTHAYFNLTFDSSSGLGPGDPIKVTFEANVTNPPGLDQYDFISGTFRVHIYGLAP